MVRGLGLGQYPTGYDPALAGHLKHAFGALHAKLPDAGGYLRFCRLLGELILETTRSRHSEARQEVQRREVGRIIDAIRSEPNAYYRISAGCILIDAVAKLDLDATLVAYGPGDFADEILHMIEQIYPDNIRDINAGQHGDYERIFSYCAVFFSFHNLGIQQRLLSDGGLIIARSLSSIENVPSPFFRGRAASMLFSAISLLKQQTLIFDGKRDFFRETFDHMDRGGSPELQVAFPQHTTVEFQRLYPLLTMLNAVAVTGRTDYLTYGGDRLEDARSYWSRLAAPECAHMSLYYVVALHNLGRLNTEIGDLDRWIGGLIADLNNVDPGTDFFLNGLASPYIMETMMVLGRLDLISADNLHRLADCFPDLDRSEVDRVNRPYPFSYAVNVLGEIGHLGLLFSGRERYGGAAPFDWVVASLSEKGLAEGNRLFMLGNALVGQALRLRKFEPKAVVAFDDFRFRKM